jgi:Zn-dependent peptidase ImmA (M78 family)
MRTTPSKRALEILEEVGINSPDFDLHKISDHFKVPIKAVEMPEDISGMLQRDSGRGTIFVNKAHHENRQRFTIAHELGHYFLNHTTGVHVDKVALFRDTESSKATSQIEMDANRFAAELLMPEQLVRSQLRQATSKGKNEDDIISEMAGLFKVSIAAMSFRLQNLGIRIAGF